MLEGRTLVLNKSWYPIATASVRSAIAMVFEGRAKVIDPRDYEVHDFESWKEIEPYSDRVVRGVSFTMQLPEVILLQTYDRLPSHSMRCSRRNLLKRDSLVCQYCGERFRASELTVDHVVPKSKGGKTNWKNCVIACRKCNHRKGSDLSHEIGMMLRKVPIEPTWSPTFAAVGAKAPGSWKRFVVDSARLQF